MLAPASRLLSLASVPAMPAITAWVKHALRYLSQHTGLPALVVAAILVAVGYRLLKKTARFATEVAIVALALVAMTELGWIVW